MPHCGAVLRTEKNTKWMCSVYGVDTFRSAWQSGQHSMQREPWHSSMTNFVQRAKSASSGEEKTITAWSRKMSRSPNPSSTLTGRVEGQTAHTEVILRSRRIPCCTAAATWVGRVTSIGVIRQTRETVARPGFSFVGHPTNAMYLPINYLSK